MKRIVICSAVLGEVEAMQKIYIYFFFFFLHQAKKISPSKSHKSLLLNKIMATSTTKQLRKTRFTTNYKIAKEGSFYINYKTAEEGLFYN